MPQQADRPYPGVTWAGVTPSHPDLRQGPRSHWQTREKGVRNEHFPQGRHPWTGVHATLEGAEAPVALASRPAQSHTEGTTGPANRVRRLPDHSGASTEQTPWGGHPGRMEKGKRVLGNNLLISNLILYTPGHASLFPTLPGVQQ